MMSWDKISLCYGEMQLEKSLLKWDTRLGDKVVLKWNTRYTTLLYEQFLCVCVYVCIWVCDGQLLYSL